MSGSQDAFSAAFGPARGPTPQQLSAELITARGEIAQLRDQLASNAAALAVAAEKLENLQRTLDERDSELEAADQKHRQALHQLERLSYLMLWQPVMPDGPQLRNRLCPYLFTEEPVSLYQGNWSARRPYLRMQIVSHGHDDQGQTLFWKALAPIQPAHLMPLLTDGIPGDEGTGEYWQPYEPEDPFDFESGVPSIDVLREPSAKAASWDRDALLGALTSTDGLHGRWKSEIRAGQVSQPCPAHAYPTYKQWRNDLPYYRSIEDGLRTRYGIDVGIYRPGGPTGSINIDPCVPEASNPAVRDILA